MQMDMTLLSVEPFCDSTHLGSQTGIERGGSDGKTGN